MTVPDTLPPLMMIMICNQCALGGAEKRYARVFEQLAAQPHSAHHIVINRKMLDLLQTSGILVFDQTLAETPLIVLDPPSHRWLRRNINPTIQRFVDIMWYTWRCWSLVHHYRPALVHPLLTAIYFCLPILLFQSGSRVVLSAYSYQFENYRDRQFLGVPIGATIKRWLMQRADAIDALSFSIRADLLERGISAVKVHVAPGSFTDLAQCRPAAHREKWVVFLGRFVEIKNPLLFVNAIPAVLQHHPDVTFYLLGEGPLGATINKRIAELGIDQQCVVQFTAEPTAVLNRSLIFLSLQTEENYPSQSLLEAMACGNVIVATDVGETWRLVDEQNGLRIQPTVTAIAYAINRLLDDPELAEKRLASRQRVLAEHTVDRFIIYITQVYQTALQHLNQ